MASPPPILLGNSFPLSLIRRAVRIAPWPLAALRNTLAEGSPIVSFWGHDNTLAAARLVLGHDPAPRAARPVLALTPDGLPTLEGHVFHDCWILSPDYRPGFRPAIGDEVTPGQIRGWQVLRLVWE